MARGQAHGPPPKGPKGSQKVAKGPKRSRRVQKLQRVSKCPKGSQKVSKGPEMSQKIKVQHVRIFLGGMGVILTFLGSFSFIITHADDRVGDGRCSYFLQELRDQGISPCHTHPACGAWCTMRTRVWTRKGPPPHKGVKPSQILEGLKTSLPDLLSLGFTCSISCGGIFHPCLSSLVASSDWTPFPTNFLKKALFWTSMARRLLRSESSHPTSTTPRRWLNPLAYRVRPFFFDD